MQLQKYSHTRVSLAKHATAMIRDKSVNPAIDGGSCRDSLVGLLQLMDLPLQFKVVGAACSHPIEERRGGGGGIIDEVRKEGRRLLRCTGTSAPLLIHLMFPFNYKPAAL